MIEKPNCYNCKFCKDIIGDAHKQCVHPKIGGERNIFGFAAFLKGHNPLNITADPSGIKNGWFIWPINFDPVWLKTCNGYQPINQQIKEKDEAAK